MATFSGYAPSGYATVPPMATPRTSTGEPGAAPRAQRRDARLNRQRIIEAARDLFARQGLGPGLNDVARHAGVGVGTVYRHFPNKEALIRAALQGRADDMLAVAQDGLSAPSGWDGLTHVLRGFVALHIADRGVRDLALGTSYGEAQIKEMRARLVPLIAEVLERARAEGAIRASISLSDLMLIMVMITELANQSASIAPGAHERYLDLMLDALRPAPSDAHLAPPPADDVTLAIMQRWLAHNRGSNDG